MRALAITSYTTPENYQLLDVETPSITAPEEVLIKVHAASINPADTKLASGIMRWMQPVS